MTTFTRVQVTELVEKATQLFGGDDRRPFKDIVNQTVKERLPAGKENFTIPEVFKLVDMSNLPVSGEVEIGQGEPRKYTTMSFADFVTRCVAEEMIDDGTTPREKVVVALGNEKLHPSGDIGVSSFKAILTAAPAAGRRRSRKTRRRTRRRTAKTIRMKKGEYLREHHHLFRVLRNPTRRALNAELRRQQKELRERGLRG
jgi:hypothetical protein